MSTPEIESDASSRPISESIGALIERVLSLRYLRGLSEEKREQLRGDLDFIRRTLLEQRAPRIAIVGDSDVEIEKLLDLLVGENVPEDVDIKAYLGRGRWYDYETERTALELLDLRRLDEDDVSFKALSRQAPDLVLFAWSFRPLEGNGDEEEHPAVDDLVETLRKAQTTRGEAPSVVAFFDEDELPESVTENRAERILRTKLRNSGIPDARLRVVPRQALRRLDAELVELAPMEARLRLTQAMESPESKRRLARLVIRASAGVTATVATIPLPFADIVPITSTQILMISSIAHLSGRRFSLKTVGEFAAAVGLNVGAGYALREIARALIQFVPFAGSVISSGIAAGATYALGNAAARYFIDDDLEDFDAAPERVREPGWRRSTVDSN